SSYRIDITPSQSAGSSPGRQPPATQSGVSCRGTGGWGHPIPGRVSGRGAGLNAPLALRPMSFRPEAIRGAHSNGAVVDYRLTRQSVVQQYRKGRLSRLDVCDAHPELRRAATIVSRPTNEGCPICEECQGVLGTYASRPPNEVCPICEESQVVLVTYAFGPRLPAGGRCITTAREMARLSRGSATITCYVVEVCPDCAWNHLTRVFQVGGG